MVALAIVTLTWVAVAIGMSTKTPGGANSGTLILQLGAFVSSAFVPSASMPAGVRWVADHQPLTPIIETLRGLLIGTPIGNSAMIAVAWCAGLGVLGYIWAQAVYSRNRER